MGYVPGNFDYGQTVVGFIVVIIILLIIIAIIAWTVGRDDCDHGTVIAHWDSKSLKGTVWQGRTQLVNDSIFQIGNNNQLFGDITLEFLNIEDRRIGVKTSWVARNPDGQVTDSGSDLSFGILDSTGSFMLTDTEEQASRRLRFLPNGNLEMTYVEWQSGSEGNSKVALQGELRQVRGQSGY